MNKSFKIFEITSEIMDLIASKQATHDAIEAIITKHVK